MTATLEAVTADAPPSLEARLSAYITANGIKGNYPADGIASRLVREIHPSLIERWLDLGGTAYLRRACRNVKDYVDLTDAEHAAEMRGAA